MRTSILSIGILFSTLALGDNLDSLKPPSLMNVKEMLQLVQENLNGWTKLKFGPSRNLWTTHQFYTKNISDPKKWMAEINHLGFCEPDRTWKSFPVMTTNSEAAAMFEEVASNFNYPVQTRTNYIESVSWNGKMRSVSYSYAQNGPLVNVSCSAANEAGDIQTISQKFDIRKPQKFEVEQKKNGKLLSI